MAAWERALGLGWLQNRRMPFAEDAFPDRCCAQFLDLDGREDKLARIYLRHRIRPFREKSTRASRVAG